MSNRIVHREYRLAWITMLFLGILYAIPALASDQEGCLICHRLGLRVAGEGGDRLLKVHDSPDWVHKALYCSDCHIDARNAPHSVAPGTAQCIGECHGGSDGAVASHRRAAFAGFTESHRRISQGNSPCKLCHSATDGKGDRSAKADRCARCHRKEYANASAGPHGSLANTARFCVNCHPAHPEGSATASTARASCGAPGCHSRVTAAMHTLVDHRGRRGTGHQIAHALVFFLLAFSGWAAGRILSPTPGRDEDGQ